MPSSRSEERDAANLRYALGLVNSEESDSPLAVFCKGTNINTVAQLLAVPFTRIDGIYGLKNGDKRRLKSLHYFAHYRQTQNQPLKMDDWINDVSEEEFVDFQWGALRKYANNKNFQDTFERDMAENARIVAKVDVFDCKESKVVLDGEDGEDDEDDDACVSMVANCECV